MYVGGAGIILGADRGNSISAPQLCVCGSGYVWHICLSLQHSEGTRRERMCESIHHLNTTVSQ